MKRNAFLLMLITGSFSLFAQSDKYKQAMLKGISELETAVQEGKMLTLANSFERIATTEKTEWLPYYYAAYCQVMAALTEKDKSVTDPMCNKAEELLLTAEKLAGGGNSETYVVHSMIATARLSVDPQSRWMLYGQTSTDYLEKAKQADSTNPRPYYLEGQFKFFTPQEFGGGKQVAAPLLEKSLAMFENFKATSDLHPTWGKSAATWFLSQCK